MAALAKKANTTASQINKLEKGQRRLTDNWLSRLASALHCNVAELKEHVTTSEPPAIRLDPAHYALVPVYSLLHHATQGGFGPVQHRAAFLRAYLRDLTELPFDKLAIFRIADDSMVDNLRPGDQVLTELSGNRLRGDGCYVLRVGGGIVVRRVSINPETGKLSIHVNNPQYQSYDGVTPDSVEVIGRVVWMGHKV